MRLLTPPKKNIFLHTLGEVEYYTNTTSYCLKPNTTRTAHTVKSEIILKLKIKSYAYRLVMCLSTIGERA